LPTGFVPFFILFPTLSCCVLLPSPHRRFPDFPPILRPFAFHCRYTGPPLCLFFFPVLRLSFFFFLWMLATDAHLWCSLRRFHVCFWSPPSSYGVFAAKVVSTPPPVLGPLFPVVCRSVHLYVFHPSALPYLVTPTRHFLVPITLSIRWTPFFAHFPILPWPSRAFFFFQ